MLQNTLPITGQLPQQCIFDPKCQYAKVNPFCKRGSASDIILANPLLFRRKRWNKKDNRQRYRNVCISYSWIHIQKRTRAKSMTNHGKCCPTREELQSQSRLTTMGYLLSAAVLYVHPPGSSEMGAQYWSTKLLS